MKNNKGFTLVELIVVLVILAILAAILVPSMISWIDEANKKAIITEARSAYVAAQAVISENYGYQKYEKGARTETYDMTDEEIAKSKEIGGYEGTIDSCKFNKETFEITELVYTSPERTNTQTTATYTFDVDTRVGAWDVADTSSTTTGGEGGEGTES